MNYTPKEHHIPEAAQLLFILDMPTCEFGQIAGGACGSSVDNPANVKSIILAKCAKAIQGHLVVATFETLP